MRDKTQNGRNLSRTQPQDSSPKPESQNKDFTQSNTTNNPTANSAGNVTDEAIDVLSFVGFKL